MRRTANTLAPQARNKEAGAALVVALILLVALSLMAISSMNTASLDLIMAGNEQYRNRAFTAAEAGIERAIKGGTFSSNADYSLTAAVATGIGSDTYNYRITRPYGGKVQPSPSGYSAAEGQFGALYFRVESTGTSERGTAAGATQELYEVVKSADGISHNDSCGDNSLDGTTSGC